MAVLSRSDCPVCLPTNSSCEARTGTGGYSVSTSRDVYSSPFIRIILRCGVDAVHPLIVHIAKQMFMRIDVQQHIQYLYQNQDDERFGILMYAATRCQWIHQQLLQLTNECKSEFTTPIPILIPTAYAIN
jgi:hypothetical protein